MKTVVKRAWKRVLSSFLAGVFALLPLVITVAIAMWVIGMISAIIGPETALGKALQFLPGQYVSNDVLATVLGWALVLAVIWAVGLVVQSRSKHLLTNLMEAIFKRIPIVGSVYGTASQFVQMLNRSDENQLQRMSVVFCKFGSGEAGGLLALMPSGEKYMINDREHCLVYLPTSPLPMTGGLIYVPTDSILPMDMPVESLISIYLSMGVTSPQILEDRLA